MVFIAIFFALGCGTLQQQAVLPDLEWAGLLATAPILLLIPQHSRWLRMIRAAGVAGLAFSLGFFHAAWIAHHRLADTLPEEWQGKNVDIIGVVAELPGETERGTRFAFDVERVLTAGAVVPSRIQLSHYSVFFPASARGHDNTLLESESDGQNGRVTPRAGERWQLTVRLKRPHGTSNPHGFDFEAWMLERNLRATGYVYGKGNNRRLDTLVRSPGYLIQRLREQVRSRFHQVLAPALNDSHVKSGSYAGVITALAIGDQSGIPVAQWQLFTRTGVNHLMSISGLHITMLSGLVFALVYAGWRRVPQLALRLPARKAAATAGLITAMLYALLTGYSVPAQRTLYMLAALAASLWLSRTVAVSQLLAAALLAVLLLDPWAILSPGFWLSFGAVALIFYVTAHRLRPTRPHGPSVAHRLVRQTKTTLVEYGGIQWAMTIGLIPPLLSLFQQFSLVSPLANAFAIPLISLVVVPLTLLGAALPFDGILHLAHRILEACMNALVWLDHFPWAAWTQHAPPPWTIGLGMMGVLWLLLPRGFPARWLGWLPMLPMFFVRPPELPEGTLRLFVFDVGQGLAVAAQTRNHALLYDTGPDFGGDADSGSRILVPSMRALGISHLDGLILSHDDNDHTGGAVSVMQSIPVGWVLSSLPEASPLLQQAPGHHHCTDGQHWQWDGVNFEVLHPPAASYTIEDIADNNRGCVLKISSGKFSILLAADIEKDVEQELLEVHADKLPSTFLVVPHHGSKTSSTQAFVEAVHPEYAVFTVGYRNRFGHPKHEVVDRYRSIGSRTLRSDEDGAIRADMDAMGLKIESARAQRKRYWHQSFQDRTE